MSEEPDLIERYEISRKYIQHEDGLINNRMTWMLTIHGFIYATYGFTLQKILEISEKISQFIGDPSKAPGIDCYLNTFSLRASLIQIFGFLFSLCIVGLTISTASFFSISGAYKAATSVRQIFDDQHEPRNLWVRHNEIWPREGMRFRRRMQYELFGPGRFRMPLLTGGGLYKGELRGFSAAASIPFFLAMSWIISGGFAVYDAIETWSLFSGRSCTQLETPLKTKSEIDKNLKEKICTLPTKTAYRSQVSTIQKIVGCGLNPPAFYSAPKP